MSRHFATISKQQAIFSLYNQPRRLGQPSSMDAGRKCCPKRPSAALGQIRGYVCRIAGNQAVGDHCTQFTPEFLTQECNQKRSLFSGHQCFCASLLLLGRSMWLAYTETLQTIHSVSRGDRLAKSRRTRCISAILKSLQVPLLAGIAGNQNTTATSCHVHERATRQKACCPVSRD